MSLRTFGAALVALLLVAALLRCVHPTADPPSGFVRGSLAEYTDEGFKTYHARNRVLFGSWLAHPADRYTIWLKWSPVAVRLHAAWFALRQRVDVGVAREIHVGASLLSLLLWALAVRRELGATVALLTTLFLTASAVATVYGRMVFLENLLLLGATALAWLLCRPRVGPAAALASTLVALGAFFVKPSALLPAAGAAVGVAALAAARTLPATGPDPARRRRLVRRTLAVAAALALALYVVLWLAPFLAAALLPLARREGLAAPWEIARNLLAQQFAAREPFLFALGLWGAARALRPLLDGHAPAARLPVVAAAWLLVGLLGLALVEGSADRVRYAVILLPPLAMLAAQAVLSADPRGLAPRADGVPSRAVTVALLLLAVSNLGYAVVLPSLDAKGGARLLPLAGLVALLLLAVLMWRAPGSRLRRAAMALGAAAVLSGLLPVAAWLLAPSFQMEAARADLSRRLPSGAFVAGSWAPALALGTPLRCVRLGPDLNLREQRLRQMAPSHLLLSDDRPEERAALDHFYPGLVRADGELAAYRIDRFTVRLYAIHWPATAAAPW